MITESMLKLTPEGNLPKLASQPNSDYYVFCQHYAENNLELIEFWVSASNINQANHKAYTYLRAEDIEPVNIKHIEIALD